ncbi:MAG: 1-deoxy-D-xylulose-5-phosphate reductoisomerase [Fibromonadaceae bacterium]|jgi:1-deoxy-D-xylulose-5-phosphate reductoisomerase|nr:1-deoxy-D-xylulose-5-phosphate reductoisomerase [Fibromonadaceae bacterium]
MSEFESVCLLGASGSIGCSALDVIDQHKERFSLHSAAAHSNVQKMAEISKKYPNAKLSLFDENAALELQRITGKKVLAGMDGLLELVSSCDLVLNGLIGSVGCEPTLKAIEHGKKIALANKETLVMAGEIIKEALQKNPAAQITPVDSEHNAIFQCLAGRGTLEVENLQITASGGPFREWPAEKFSEITLKDALNHPVWSMGKKITIDSASMMNKGLEVIEAHFLFDVPYEQIKVVVHPQSIVHSLVQFRDGSMIAQLGAPDMRIPILNAMTFPERLHLDTKRLNLPEIQKLTFFEPDFKKFPCLALAYEAGKAGGTRAAVLNAANEILVNAFLQEKISFTDIPKGIEHCLNKIEEQSNVNLEKILSADSLAREEAKKYTEEVCFKPF